MAVDITTNNNTVWINDLKGCFGRFCEMSGEVRQSDTEPWIVVQKESWLEWKNRVEIYVKYKISDEYQPPWSIKEEEFFQAIEKCTKIENRIFSKKNFQCIQKN